MSRRQNKSKNILFTFLAGATAGAISIYLSKKENRKELIDKYQESKNKILDTTYDVIDDLSYNIENFDKDDFIDHTKDNLNRINKDIERQKNNIKENALKKTQTTVKNANKKIDSIQRKLQKKVDNLNK